jgi:hypothetical protein
LKFASNLSCHNFVTNFRMGALRVVYAPARQFVGVLNSLEVAFPVFAMLSLCSSAEFFMRSARPEGWNHDDGPLAEPVVTLPEVAIENADADIAAALRPALDALWNGFGWASCDLYSPSGEWLGGEGWPGFGGR